MIKFFTLCAAVAMALTAQADTIVNTFATGPLGTSFGNGTTVYALGVTFGFSIASGATYGDTINTTANVTGTNFTDPVLDGDATGTLTLTFDVPTTFVSFDVLMVPAGDSGGTVTIASTGYNFTTTGGQGAGSIFSIGAFNSGALSPFTSASISFNSGADTMFAIDNLSYQGAPEPSSFFLLLAGALVIGASLSLRRRTGRQISSPRSR